MKFLKNDLFEQKDTMMLRQLFHLWKLKLRLKAIQRQYYTRLKKEDEVTIIQGYLNTLNETRATYVDLLVRANKLFKWKREFLPIGTEVCAHLGCGGNRIEGWYNFDVDPHSKADVRANLAKGIPLRTESVDYIHSEDFLEHINLKEGSIFLADCFRILKPGGVMRLLTPDLRSLVKKLYLGRSKRHLHWCLTNLDAKGPCESLNMHMRMEDAHCFLYDYELLSCILRDIGFNVKRVSYNASTHPILRFNDLRDFKLNLFLECKKHGDNLKMTVR